MKKGHPFDKRLRAISPEIIKRITQIDECKGRWISGAHLSPQILGRLKQFVLVTSTGASTRIEGAKLSDKDVEKLMRGLSVQKFADRDRQEVKGYYELLQNVFESWRAIRFLKAPSSIFMVSCSNLYQKTRGIGENTRKRKIRFT